MTITVKYRINGALFRRRFSSRAEADQRAALLIANGIPVVISPTTTRRSKTA